MSENRMQTWLRNSGPDFIATKSQPLILPDVNCLDYRILRNVRGLPQLPSKNRR